MRRVPLFPLTEPDQWDEYTLLAATILLEAEGEPPDGNDGVAHVVMSRHRIWNRPIHNVILGLDGKSDDIYEPFSCWNSDYRTRALTRLAAADDQPLITAWRAAAGSLWQFTRDPTGGALFYLNLLLTKKIRGGTLPSWFSEEKVTCTIGRHTFLKG